jgi:DNA-binding transcriptional LysR family regulator
MHIGFAKNAKPNHNQFMDIDDLQVFVRVAELGSLSAAARERDAPVSQVSRALSRLEALHRMRLLHRSTHSLSLTDAGQALLDHGRRMLASYEDLQADFAREQAAVNGTVHIGVSPAMASFVIVPALAELARVHPQLRVELHVDDRPVDIAQQGVDFAIRTGPLGSDNLVARPIGQHGRRLYATPAYLKAYGVPRRIDDLDAHRLIVNSVIPNFNRWPFRVKGQDIVYQPRGFYRASSTGTMMSLALQGLGIVRGNTAICDPLVRSGELVYVLNDIVVSPIVPINAVMLQERHRSPKIRACIDFFSEWLQSHGMPIQNNIASSVSPTPRAPASASPRKRRAQ